MAFLTAGSCRCVTWRRSRLLAREFSESRIVPDAVIERIEPEQSGRNRVCIRLRQEAFQDRQGSVVFSKDDIGAGDVLFGEWTGPAILRLLRDVLGRFAFHAVFLPKTGMDVEQAGADFRAVVSL